MIEFRRHPKFEKEIAVLERRRFRHLKDGLNGFQKLCEFHFHPTNPERRIDPGKLHRVTSNDVWTMWKIELVIIKSGLRPDQYPRIWFVVSGATIVFLCIADHASNYSDYEMDRTALARVTDVF